MNNDEPCLSHIAMTTRFPCPGRVAAGVGTPPSWSSVARLGCSSQSSKTLSQVVVTSIQSFLRQRSHVVRCVLKSVSASSQSLIQDSHTLISFEPEPRPLIP